MTTTVPEPPDTAPATYDPVRLVAEVEIMLHHFGIPTVAGAGVTAVQAAGHLLGALGVVPVDPHQQMQYRVRLVDAPRTRQSALAASEDAAHILASAWNALPSSRTGRTVTVIEPVTAPLADAA